MSISLRVCVGALLVGGAVLAGCPSEDDATNNEDLTADAAPPLPCGRLNGLCAEGRTCEGPQDCSSGLCRDGKCGGIDPANNEKNNDETDVDCGGTRAPACADNKGCVIAADCKNGVCKTNICQPPSPTDGVTNGDETGLDCGGSKAPK